MSLLDFTPAGLGLKVLKFLLPVLLVVGVVGGLMYAGYHYCYTKEVKPREDKLNEIARKAKEQKESTESDAAVGKKNLEESLAGLKGELAALRVEYLKKQAANPTPARRSALCPPPQAASGVQVGPMEYQVLSDSGLTRLQEAIARANASRKH